MVAEGQGSSFGQQRKEIHYGKYLNRPVLIFESREVMGCTYGELENKAEKAVPRAASPFLFLVITPCQYLLSFMQKSGTGTKDAGFLEIRPWVISGPCIEAGRLPWWLSL